MAEEVKTAPFQLPRCPRPRGEGGKIPWDLHLLAYEVYRAIYGEQKALVEGWCRGGFGTGELLAFLYARNFPPNEWSDRVDYAHRHIRTSE